MKLRVSAAPTSVERRYGAWIGGSIVSSLVINYQKKILNTILIFF